MTHADGSKLTRRNFLAAAGVAGGVLAANQAGLFAAEGPASAPASAPAGPKVNLAKKPFGKTGMDVALVGFGAIRLQDPIVGVRLLSMAVDNGVNLIHTARGYTKGKSVASIGRFLDENKGVRGKIILCLKENPKVSEERLDADLKNLGTDYADAYLPELQNPDQAVMEDALAALDKLKKKGKIRYGGFTTHSNINEVLELILSKAPKGYDCCLLSTAPLRPADSGEKTADEQTKRFADNLKKLSQAGVGVISMKSGASKVVGQGPQAYGAHMRVLAAAGVASVATSFASVQTLETAFKSGLDKLEPTAADHALWRRQWLTDAWPCTMCGTCTGACPAHLPVSDLMRMAMYRDHYKMARHARQEFAGLGIDATTALAACDDCTSCSGVCPVGLASAHKVRDVITSLA